MEFVPPQWRRSTLDRSDTSGAIAEAEEVEVVKTVGEPPCLVCDPFQAKTVREKYRNLRRWYEAEAASTPGFEQNIGHWGVSYDQYVNGFVADVVEGMQLQPNDAVFESAVGAGWLLRGLRQLLPLSIGDTLKLCGNDIIPMALDFAERGLQSSVAPAPVLCLGDSANLTTWVPAAAFDAVLCGYTEPGADGEDWTGNWVRQMAWCAKPGGLIFVGNNRMPTPNPRPGQSAGGLPMSWWVEQAESNAFGWDVDPSSVRFTPLKCALLEEKWGARYAVYMRRRS